MNKKLFIDLGAHEGDSLDKFYNQVEDAADYDIYSFEPHPVAFKKLNEHIKLCGYKNVITINKAAGIFDNSVAELFLASTYEGKGSTLLHNKITSKINYDNPIEVGCFSFCNWLTKRRNEYDYIILKMNIEGSEYPIIKEMLKCRIISSIDYYCVYFHQNRFADCNKLAFLIIENSFIKEVKRLRIPLCINRHSFNEDNRPEVLWICDVPGWSYDKRATELSPKLPQFRHTKIYLAQSEGFRSVRSVGRAVDIIVCSHPVYMQFFNDLNKVVIRLDGFRAFENANNAQHRECQELELVPGNDTINKKVQAGV